MIVVKEDSILRQESMDEFKATWTAADVDEDGKPFKAGSTAAPTVEARGTLPNIAS